MRSVLPLLILLLAWSAMQGQNPRPETGKRYPSFIYLEEENVELTRALTLFNTVFQTDYFNRLQSMEMQRDELGFLHERFQQYYNGIKVDGATYTLHAKGGMIKVMSGNYRSVWGLESTTPSMSSAAAFLNALMYVGAQRYNWQADGGMSPKGELVILADPAGQEESRLAYKFDIYALEPLYRADVYIDAHTGELLRENHRLHTNVPASGPSLYNGTVSFTAESAGTGNYRLRQTQQGQGIQTYTLKNGTSYAGAADITSNSTSFTGDRTAVQAHFGAEKTHQYFLRKHNRNSFDGTGGIVRSYVHYGTNYVNAFWDGQRVTYGDGNGSSYLPMVSLDIVGHELSHGVTDHSADLVYAYESGALNESFSDIFAEAIEFFVKGTNDWQIGADIDRTGNGGFRSMKDPNKHGDPDTYKGQNWYLGSGDNGGVHINSGVQNKWFYILVNGESGVNDLGNRYSVNGIGMDKAAAIAYRNLTVYLSSSSGYGDARQGAILAARDLYGPGSAEEIATANAWYAVGVGGEFGMAAYCESEGNNAGLEWISEVKIGSFTNASSGNGYTDFTGKTINLTPGLAYEVVLTPGFSANAYSEYWRIWIDYNADQDFSDPGEEVFAPATSTSGIQKGSFSVPFTATGSTRMRIAMRWETPSQPCEYFPYGEVEDYTVSFSAPAPDKEPPTAPLNLAAINTTQTSTLLTWTASTDNVGVTGYNVYVGNTKIGTTTDTKFQVNDLLPSNSYTMRVEAFDAAGNSSFSAIRVTTRGTVSQTKLLGAYYFEEGWENWEDGGIDCFRYQGPESPEGQYSIRLRDNSGVESSMTSPVYDLTNYLELSIKFYFFTSSMEPGKEFLVQFFDGSNWHAVASYVSGTNFVSDKEDSTIVLVKRLNYNFGSNARVRFMCNAGDNSDLVYIDQVTIIGRGSSSDTETGTGDVPLVIKPGLQPTMKPAPEAADLRLFPNPAHDRLQVDGIPGNAQVRSITIYSINGSLMSRYPGSSYGQPLDVSGLKPGVYVVRVVTTEGMVSRRFLKQ